MLEKLMSIDWSPILSVEDANGATDTFYDILLK